VKVAKPECDIAAWLRVQSFPAAAPVGSSVVVAEPVEWLSPAEQQVWRRLLAADCRVRERLDRELRAGAGITLGEYEVLVHLSEAPAQALRMSELADRLFLSRSGLTRRIDGLVQAGVVARRPCENDGRGALAALTPTGFGLLQQAAPIHVAGVRRYVIEPVAGSDGPAGLAGLARGLARVERALEDS
jgi:DNA-binding MarR family transcriptional regulator